MSDGKRAWCMANQDICNRTVKQKPSLSGVKVIRRSEVERKDMCGLDKRQTPKGRTDSRVKGGTIFFLSISWADAVATRFIL